MLGLGLVVWTGVSIVGVIGSGFVGEGDAQSDPICPLGISSPPSNKQASLTHESVDPREENPDLDLDGSIWEKGLRIWRHLVLAVVSNESP